MNSFWLMLAALGVYAIFYRYYSAFVASRVVALDDSRITPAHRLNDGQNYHPTNRWVLWGHHFAAIAGAGPLIGPVMAAQFGYMPGLLWLVFGVCLGGAVQDFIILTASMRRNGRSLAEIARSEIGPVGGTVAMIAILFIVVVALAVLGFVVVNALAESAWGTFTIAASIPIALFMGLYMYRFRKGKVAEASALGVAALVFCVIAGAWFQPGGPWEGLAHLFTLNKQDITTAMAIYGFIASVLPVWLLLCPRDYLSSYMKVGTVFLIVAAVLLVRPDIKAPAFSEWVTGGGPLVKGPLFPFVFITIACGAISGFHALVSSGTTPKMIERESHARSIGYGAMVMESLVGVVALIAACALQPADYFQINLTPEQFKNLIATSNLEQGHLSELAGLVGEKLEGRAGGGVSLAVGIAQIMGAIPGLQQMMSYFYHFVIMFEALFVLTTIDTGTRIARFLVQEFMGRFHAPLGRTDWMPGTVFASFLVVAGWSYFIYTGQIQTLWPMFGVANQLLAVVALAIATTVLINEGRSKYAWVTIGPMLFVGVTTVLGGLMSIKDIYIPMAQANKVAGDQFKGYLNAGLVTIMLICVFVILCDAVPRWLRHWNTGREETRELLESSATVPASASV
ncbi:MAG: carbon starvation protein A [Armatimonadetes bacterium]|nr:carbon starvation protein A [Armatimonadota bacterium]